MLCSWQHCNTLKCSHFVVQVLIWDTRSGQVAQTIQEHAGAVLCLTFDPAHSSSAAPCRWLVSGGEDGHLLVHDTRTWRMITTLQQPPSLTSSTGVSRHGSFDSTLLSASFQDHLNMGGNSSVSCDDRRWEGETRGATMVHAVNACAASADSGERGSWLAAAWGGKMVRLWHYSSDHFAMDDSGLLNENHASPSSSGWTTVGCMNASLGTVNSVCLHGWHRCS
jgi:hypothetical protein